MLFVFKYLSKKKMIKQIHKLKHNNTSFLLIIPLNKYTYLIKLWQEKIFFNNFRTIRGWFLDWYFFYRYLIIFKNAGFGILSRLGTFFWLYKKDKIHFYFKHNNTRLRHVFKGGFLFRLRCPFYSFWFL